MGFNTSDDAGVYKINEDTALVMTADFITPPVDDPYIFGQIAAANAISDVYAMGGKPIACLNLVAFPAKRLDADQLGQIVAGGLSKITESGAVLAGGHSIDDSEPKFGLSVTGIVHPKKFWHNGGARPGDAVVLTKPVGTGVLFNADIKGWVSASAMSECIAQTTYLNKTAAEVLAKFDIHAATDVTGFGIGGHCLEVARASDALIRIHVSEIPTMAEALAMYERGMTTGVNKANRQMLADHTEMRCALPPWHTEIIFDPQTSGGLLAIVPGNQASNVVSALHSAGMEQAAIIGHIENRTDDTFLSFE